MRLVLFPALRLELHREVSDWKRRSDTLVHTPKYLAAPGPAVAHDMRAHRVRPRCQGSHVLSAHPGPCNGLKDTVGGKVGRRIHSHSSAQDVEAQTVFTPTIGPTSLFRIATSSAQSSPWILSWSAM